MQPLWLQQLIFKQPLMLHELWVSVPFPFTHSHDYDFMLIPLPEGYSSVCIEANMTKRHIHWNPSVFYHDSALSQYWEWFMHRATRSVFVWCPSCWVPLTLGAQLAERALNRLWRFYVRKAPRCQPCVCHKLRPQTKTFLPHFFKD